MFCCAITTSFLGALTNQVSTTKKRKFSCCGEEGHDKRTCKVICRTTSNAVKERVTKPGPKKKSGSNQDEDSVNGLEEGDIDSDGSECIQRNLRKLLMRPLKKKMSPKIL